MANFVAVVDPDPARRRKFVQRVRNRLAPVPDLGGDEISRDEFHLLWAAGRAAPVSTYEAAEGIGVLWGRARRPDTGSPLDAGTLFRRWTAPGNPGAPQWNGFHAGVAYDSDTGIWAGGDTLGLFPLYHGTSGTVTILSSTLDPFRIHPGFGSGLHKEGLAGALLTGGTFRGRTLMGGVRRLPPGHLLRITPNGEVEEVEIYSLPLEQPELDLTDDQIVEAIHDALTRAMRTGLADRARPTVLLSGGRDSRLLTGYAHRVCPQPLLLTFGRASDYEAVCAADVARSLRLPHEVTEIPYSKYPRYARRQVRHEGLMSNFSGIYTWGNLESLGRGSCVISGHLLELLVGGVQLDWAASEETGDPSDRRFLDHVAAHGIPRKRLLRLTADPELEEAVKDTWADVETLYASGGMDIGRRAQGYLFRHWGRCHPGAVPWRMSFASWPALPFLDTRLLNLACRLPSSLVRQRFVQDRLLERYFPDLARDPLVRPSGDLHPIASSWRWRARSLIMRRGGRLRGWLPGTGERYDPSDMSRRRYRRIYDLDNQGWRAVRRAAEPHRDALHELFHRDQVDRFLPPAARSVSLERPILEGFGRKSLLALMLASDEF